MGIRGQSVVSVFERLVRCSRDLDMDQLTMCKGPSVVVSECKSGAKVGKLLPEESILVLCYWRLRKGDFRDIRSSSRKLALQAALIERCFFDRMIAICMFARLSVASL